MRYTASCDMNFNTAINHLFLHILYRIGGDAHMAACDGCGHSEIG